MNILFVHEVDWLNKVVFDIHSLSESLALLGHQVYAIDYENTWSRNGFLDFSGLDTLIPRFAEVIKQMPQAKLLIVGDGPQYFPHHRCHQRHLSRQDSAISSLWEGGDSDISAWDDSGNPGRTAGRGIYPQH